MSRKCFISHVTTVLSLLSFLLKDKLISQQILTIFHQLGQRIINVIVGADHGPIFGEM